MTMDCKTKIMLLSDSCYLRKHIQLLVNYVKHTSTLTDRQTDVPSSLSAFVWQDMTGIQKLSAHSWYRPIGRQTRLPYPLLASKWIHLVYPLQALHHTDVLSKPVSIRHFWVPGTSATSFWTSHLAASSGRARCRPCTYYRTTTTTPRSIKRRRPS